MSWTREGMGRQSPQEGDLLKVGLNSVYRPAKGLTCILS